MCIRDRFQPWLELASREKTAGWIFPGDLWPAPDGRVHIVWTERALDERLRDTFFPDTEQSHAINYAVLRDGQVLLRRTLLESRPGGSQEIPSAPRFQVTPDHRLFLFYYVQGTNPAGTHVSENRVLEIAPDATLSSPVRIDLKQPFTAAFTATPRAGSPPSETLELLGPQAGKPNTISYARIRLN